MKVAAAPEADVKRMIVIKNSIYDHISKLVVMNVINLKDFAANLVFKGRLL